MMSLIGVNLDNFIKTNSMSIAKSSAGLRDNCSFIATKGHKLPVKANSLIMNFDFENEVETEVDVLPTIELNSCNFNIRSLERIFLDVYSTYSFITVKVEFLDIFSPPPNC